MASARVIRVGEFCGAIVVELPKPGSDRHRAHPKWQMFRAGCFGCDRVSGSVNASCDQVSVCSRPELVRVLNWARE